MKIISVLILYAIFSGCYDAGEKKMVSNEAPAVLPDASSYPLELDMTKNATDFIAHCQTCHTPRYIEMQPKFSRKAWEKTVEKMIHSYGAQIDSATASRIVDYLVYVQG